MKKIRLAIKKSYLEKADMTRDEIVTYKDNY